MCSLSQNRWLFCYIRGFIALVIKRGRWHFISLSWASVAICCSSCRNCFAEAQVVRLRLESISSRLTVKLWASRLALPTTTRCESTSANFAWIKALSRIKTSMPRLSASRMLWRITSSISQMSQRCGMITLMRTPRSMARCRCSRTPRGGIK